MADPATTAMLAKAAAKIASDKRVQKIIASVAAGFLFLLILPLIILMSVGDGGADQNRLISKAMFDSSFYIGDLPEEQQKYIQDMRDAFSLLDIEIEEFNGLLEDADDDETKKTIDDYEIKSLFATLYYGKELNFDDSFYKEFVKAFLISTGNDENESYKLSHDKVKTYEIIGELTGIPITETILANASGLYSYVKYGFVGNIDNMGIPGEYLDDEVFAQLMAEATKHIGKPYVWGGSNPSTSFDCSGFVCWSYTNSGVYNLPRNTAQGIYNQCTVVSKDEVMPGDLVFFTGTYDTTSTITHIGIYVGDDRMLHAGDPIGYASLKTSYWKKHFYSYGRLN